MAVVSVNSFDLYGYTVGSGGLRAAHCLEFSRGRAGGTVEGQESGQVCSATVGGRRQAKKERIRYASSYMMSPGHNNRPGAGALFVVDRARRGKNPVVGQVTTGDGAAWKSPELGINFVPSSRLPRPRLNHTWGLWSGEPQCDGGAQGVTGANSGLTTALTPTAVRVDGIVENWG